MIAELLIKLVVSQIAEPLWQEIITTGITARIKEELVRRRIGSAITDSLTDALTEVPGFEVDLEDQTVKEFLGSPVVVREMTKVASWHEFPNVGVLRDEWARKSAITSAGKVEILLNSFLNRLRKKLFEIPDLRDAIFQRETLSSLSSLKSSFDSFQSQFIQFAESKLDPTEIKSKEEVDLQTKLDTYRDLIKKGFPNSALLILQDKEREFLSSNASNQLRSQFQGLLGFSHYLLGNYDEAIKRFEIALTLNPENPKALSNAALAALLDNRLAKAIERATSALDKGGSDTSARAILVNAKAIQQNFNDLDDLINEDTLDNVDYTRALASIFYQAQRFDLAEKYFRLCLAQNPSDFHAQLGLASILVNPTRHTFRFTATVAIDEAMQHVKNAVDIAYSGDNDNLKSQAISARSGIYLAKGDLLNAKKDCDSVLNKFPNNEISLHNRGLIAFIEGNYALSIEYISKLSEDYIIRDKLASLLAEAQIANNVPNDSISTINKFINKTDPIEQTALNTIKAKALIILNDEQEPQKIKDELLSRGPAPYSLLGASEIAERQGFYEESVKILEEAYRTTADDTKEKSRISLMLALTLYHHKDFFNSIKWFDKLPREFLSDTELSNKYINALFSIKRYGETYKALQDTRALGVISSSLLELESWLAEFFGDRNLAIELQKQLIKQDPEKIHFKVELARLEFLNNQLDSAKETLSNIDTIALNDANTLMLIAEMYSYISENTKAIRLAYKARKLGINIPGIHLTYISLFTRVEEEINDLLSVNIVQPDTAIFLSTLEEETNDLIDAEATQSKIILHFAIQKDSFWVKLPATLKPSGDWEFSTDSDTGKLLLGHKVGDLIEFKSTPLETLTYKIQEIQSVYVRAFQESIEEFGTRFPKHEGIQKMDMSDGDISKIVIPLYKRSSYVDQVYELYKAGQLPLCIVASMIKASQLEVFWTFLADKEKRIYASHGSEDDQKQQSSAVVNAKSITLDITGFLTLSYLNLLNILNKRYEHIYIHQTLIDEFDSLIISRGFELKKGMRFMGYHDGLPFFEEVSPKTIEENLQHLSSLRSFLREKCTVIPVPPEISDQLLLPDEMQDSIGHLSISTMLVAKCTDTPLCSDDAVLRGIAKFSLGVNGVWSQILLGDAMQKGIITEGLYTDACAKLIKAKFFFVAVNKYLIMFSLNKSAYIASNEPTKFILNGLKGPEANEDNSIAIAADVLSDIWRSTAILPDQKRFVLDAILRSLYMGRSNDLVTIKLLNALRLHFQNAKDALTDISNQVRLFYAVINKIR